MTEEEAAKLEVAVQWAAWYTYHWSFWIQSCIQPRLLKAVAESRQRHLLRTIPEEILPRFRVAVALAEIEQAPGPSMN
jgi:hypothetical protein